MKFYDQRFNLQFHERQCYRNPLKYFPTTRTIRSFNYENVGSGAHRTNSMNINQLWRRAANPEADIWQLHTEQSWRHHPNVSEKSNISLTAFPPALLRTSALNSSNANRNKHRNNWQLLTWTSLCSLKLNQAYCYKPYVYHFPVCVPMFTVLLSNNSSSSYVN